MALSTTSASAAVLATIHSGRNPGTVAPVAAKWRSSCRVMAKTTRVVPAIRNGIAHRLGPIL